MLPFTFALNNLQKYEPREIFLNINQLICYTMLEKDKPAWKYIQINNIDYM